MNIPDLSRLKGDDQPAIFIKFFDKEQQKYGAKRFFYDDILRIEHSIEKGKNFIVTVDSAYETPVPVTDIYECLPQEDFTLYSDCLVLRNIKTEEHSVSKLEIMIKEYCKNGFEVQNTDRVFSIGDMPVPPYCFAELGSEILNGYIEISSNGKIVKVIPKEVEFYYHEEEGTEKDFIVYHKNDAKHPSRPLFKFGLLNNHNSGIDLTFEHYNDKKNTVCRASALIRSYKIEGSDTLEMLEVSEEENRPTYLPGILLGQFGIFDGFSVKWKDGKNHADKFKFSTRHNVCKYDADGNKIPGTQDERPWSVVVK